MTVTPRHAPRDTCDEGCHCQQFHVYGKQMKEPRLTNEQLLVPDSGVNHVQSSF